jgi:hypothetical protein
VNAKRAEMIEIDPHPPVESPPATPTLQIARGHAYIEDVVEVDTREKGAKQP